MSDLNDSEESRAFYGEKADEIKPSTVKQEEEPMIQQKFPQKKKKKKIASTKKREKSGQLTKNERKNMVQRGEGEAKADQLISSMEKVYKQDQMLIKNGGLAHKRIIFCKELERELRNVFVCEGFLQMGGLSIIHHWLTKPVSGIEPSLTLKLKIFKIIYELKIHQQHLSEALELQAVVQKNRRSLMKQIRELSEAIILKWGKIAYDDIN